MLTIKFRYVRTRNIRYHTVLHDFFFFKQKTAYEMRISDWSSDVCSSDLHFFHLAGELLQAEGLGQEVNAGVLVEALAEAVLGIAGDEDHLQIRAGLAHLAHQARPVEARHHHVGDQQVEDRKSTRLNSSH